MNKVLWVLSAILVSSSAMALPKPALTCKSIDVTGRPYYTVKLYLLDVTHPGYYGATIEKVTDLAGEQVQLLRKEGPGKITPKAFAVDFGDGESLTGRRLGNGFLKGELNLVDERSVELGCE